MKTQNQIILILIPVILFQYNLFSQCISGNCNNGFGIYVFQDKSRYEGEWKMDKKNGTGKYIFSDGAVYDGIFLNDKITGKGKLLTADGITYVGDFKEGSFNGNGNITFKNGDKYSGLFLNNNLDGKGIYYLKNGDRYEGGFAKNMFEGFGIYYKSNGDRFEGGYKNDKRNGQGIYYYAKGGTLKGLWVDGEYVSGSNKETNNDSTVIMLTKSKHGVFEIPVMINEVLKFDMIFDTGASEILFTPDVVLTLYRTKTVTDADTLEGGYFIDANGNVNKSIRFNIRQVKIGNITIRDVAAGVSNSVDGMNLFGLSALEKLGKVEIDFPKHLIKIKN